MGFSAKVLSIGVLLLLADRAKIRADGGTEDGTEIGAVDRDDGTFPDHGLKTNGEQRYERPDDADGMLKNKADILSRLLKIHIDRLRDKTDQVWTEETRTRGLFSSPFFFLPTRVKKKRKKIRISPCQLFLVHIAILICKTCV